jgi:serine/threonine-protein kinase
MGLTNLIGEVLDEKYRIEKELGRGGMGSVYSATHLGTDRPVAVKVIAAQFMRNDEFVERFKREAKAAGRLHHPNVLNVTDFGFARVGQDRVAYLVMEFLDGCPLAEVLEEESQLAVPGLLSR